MTNSQPTARPEEPPSSGGVSKGARRAFTCKVALRRRAMIRIGSLSASALLSLSVLAGCAGHAPFTSPRVETITAARTVIPKPHEPPGVIGRVQAHRITHGETLLDVARDAGLGFQEVQDANPSLDEWIPTPDAKAVIPSQWIVPRSHYRGVVINIPEMRLYMFPPNARPGDRVRVRTWPVGIGTDEAPSPVGTFTVTAKDENPTWIVPESIRRTMDEPKRIVPPGPDNPLGKYRIRLSKGTYQIHGTNTPWAIGRLTTHGCIRLYPEHIPELYALTNLGTPGELIYRPVKFGEAGSRIYVQVHRDVYGRIHDLQAYARAEAAKIGVADRVDPARLRLAVRTHTGLVVDVTKSDAGAYQRVGLGSP